jgi:hypothetical protein
LFEERVQLDEPLADAGDAEAEPVPTVAEAGDTSERGRPVAADHNGQAAALPWLRGRSDRAERERSAVELRLVVVPEGLHDGEELVGIAAAIGIRHHAHGFVLLGQRADADAAPHAAL